jgi:hypothetical protein
MSNPIPYLTPFHPFYVEQHLERVGHKHVGFIAIN